MIKPTTSFLVVHHDDEQRSILAHLLDRYTRVEAVSNAAETLDTLDTRRFDLVLLGTGLPGLMRSSDLVEKIAYSHPHLPILIIGSGGNEPSLSACLNAGATDALMLPTSRLVFHNRLERMLHTRELEKRVSDLMDVVIPAGVQLATERDSSRLLDSIVTEAQMLTHADAGTLYLRTAEDTLAFVIFRTDSLDIHLGGTSGVPVSLPDIPLYVGGEPNHTHIASYTALTGDVVNIPDAYEAEGFDFSGTREFDDRTGYGSVSFLTVPLKNADERVIGVLQLINAQDGGTVVPFDASMHGTITSMAELATVALETALREEHLRERLGAVEVTYDQDERDHQVARITGTTYFQKLQELKNTRRGNNTT